MHVRKFFAQSHTEHRRSCSWSISSTAVKHVGLEILDEVGKFHGFFKTELWAWENACIFRLGGRTSKSAIDKTWLLFHVFDWSIVIFAPALRFKLSFILYCFVLLIYECGLKIYLIHILDVTSPNCDPNWKCEWRCSYFMLNILYALTYD